MLLFTALLAAILASTISAEFNLANSNNPQDLQSEVQSIAGLFDGCYSDSNNTLTDAKNYHQNLPKNTNAICVGICQENGYAITATRGADCFCSNWLPLPVLHLSHEDEAAGNGGPCSIKCPGAYTDTACKGDECCGGDDAYTVYIVGEVDVLDELMDRIVTNFQLYKDRMHNNILSAEEKDLLNCQCFSGDISIILTAKSLKDGESRVKTIKVQFFDDNPQEPEEIVAVEGLRETQLIVTSINRLFQTEDTILEEAFGDWDVFCDNYLGDGDLTCAKEFSETIGSDTTFSTEHGVDISVTFGLEFTSNALFAMSTKTFEISAGYSYTQGYSQTTSSEKSEAFSVEVNAESGTKVEVRLFKSDIPTKVKWRAKFLADGNVLIRYGTAFNKIVDLSRVLEFDQREIFAFGTIDYGERQTIIARTRALDKDGNTISLSQEEKDLQT